MGILTLKEILETKDFIDFDVGENVGIISGKIVESTPIPSADGYSIIAWATQLPGWEEDGNRAIVRFGNFYPIEVYNQREGERKKNEPNLRRSTFRRGNKGNFDLYLVRLLSDTPIYKFGPSDRPSGGSFHYPKSDSYANFFQRLTQEEMVLK